MAVEVGGDRVVVALKDLVGVVALVAHRVDLAERHVPDCVHEGVESARGSEKCEGERGRTH